MSPRTIKTILACAAAAAALSAGACSARERIAFLQHPAPPFAAPQAIQEPPADTPPPTQGQAACEPFASVAATDGDGDFARNRAALSSPDLCLSHETFREGGLTWTLQVARNLRNPGAALWFAPHDNENAAFDSGVAALLRHGGTLVAVETGGSRHNGPQDPNRNFDAGGAKCAQQVARSPEYTRRVLAHRPEGAPVIALHTNERGYAGDGRGGAGAISMARTPPGSWPVRAPSPIASRSPEDTMAFVASTAPRGSDPALSERIAALSARGINVILESVSATRNDCSLSNYAALAGLRDYVNIEVVHGDAAAQGAMIDAILPVMAGRAEPVARAAPALSRRRGASTGTRETAAQPAGGQASETRPTEPQPAQRSASPDARGRAR